MPPLSVIHAQRRDMGNIAKIGWVVACVLIGPACHAPEPGPTAPLPPSLVTIRGSVADAVDWLGPVAAKIEVIGGPLSGLSTTTDRNGAFELTGPFGNTNVTLRVSAEPYYATRTFT